MNVWFEPASFAFPKTAGSYQSESDDAACIRSRQTGCEDSNVHISASILSSSANGTDPGRWYVCRLILISRLVETIWNASSRGKDLAKSLPMCSAIHLQV